MSNYIAVSVICLVYNHENFLEKCLSSLVCQKTNFDYEVIVHDDASTDKSQDIIKKYAKNYPDIIKTIIQEDNQYSKGIAISQDIVLPECNGKYITFCEGDDFWTDENKLQLQYDVLENNEDCAMCVHNTIIHDLSGKTEDKLFFDEKEIVKMNDEDVFMKWKVHTSSYFIKKEFAKKTELSKKYWFGDYVLLTYAYDKGSIIQLPNIMSCYNYNNTEGVTYKIASMQEEKAYRRNVQRIEYLEEYNKFTEYRHDEIVRKRIREIDFSLIRSSIDRKFLNEEYDFEKFKECAIQISGHPYFEVWRRENGVLRFLKRTIQYKGYRFKLIWKLYFLIKNNRK